MPIITVITSVANVPGLLLDIASLPYKSRVDDAMIKEDLLPHEMEGMEAIPSEFTVVQVIIHMHDGSGPAIEWKASGFTVPGYIKDERCDAIHMEFSTVHASEKS